MDSTYYSNPYPPIYKHMGMLTAIVVIINSHGRAIKIWRLYGPAD